MAASSSRTPRAAHPPPVTNASGVPYTETREFGVWALLGMLAAGAALGAGAAVLLAPDSGEKTRRRFARQTRRLTGGERRRWKRLGRVLERALEERRVQRRAERLAAERARSSVD